jgi:Ran GTPase-activating protein (RanGAP) involved in mRNA processing and transport
VLTIRQTEASLVEILQLNFRDAEGIVQQKPIDKWPELAELEEGERVVAARPAAEALVRLSYRCFPSYRPLLQEYQQVLDAISKNQTTNVASRLAALAETRKTMIERADRGRDYLDWFEITRAKQISGVFDDYLELKERLKDRSHRRKDSISNYLDRMDRIFYREEEAPLPGGEFTFPSE